MAGKFDFELDVSFNDMADAKFTAAMPETFVFAPGTQYTFTLKMKGRLHATDADGGALG